MPASFEFFLGFSCFGIVALLYLLNEFIGLLRELVELLREELKDE